MTKKNIENITKEQDGTKAISNRFEGLPIDKQQAISEFAKFILEDQEVLNVIEETMKLANNQYAPDSKLKNSIAESIDTLGAKIAYQIYHENALSTSLWNEMQKFAYSDFYNSGNTEQWFTNRWQGSLLPDDNELLPPKSRCNLGSVAQQLITYDREKALAGTSDTSFAFKNNLFYLLQDIRRYFLSALKLQELVEAMVSQQVLSVQLYVADFFFRKQLANLPAKNFDGKATDSFKAIGEINRYIKRLSKDNDWNYGPLGTSKPLVGKVQPHELNMVLNVELSAVLDITPALAFNKEDFSPVFNAYKNRVEVSYKYKLDNTPNTDIEMDTTDYLGTDKILFIPYNAWLVKKYFSNTWSGTWSGGQFIISHQFEGVIACLKYLPAFSYTNPNMINWIK